MPMMSLRGRFRILQTVMTLKGFLAAAGMQAMFGLLSGGQILLGRAWETSVRYSSSANCYRPIGDISGVAPATGSRSTIHCGRNAGP